MRRLGAIFAGGQARRFGGDKAAARIDDLAMIEHVALALGPECDALVVVGRDWPGMNRIEDRPFPGLGPLGALAGALHHARDAGFDEVLTSGCDLPALPHALGELLSPAPAVVTHQPLLGLWPATFDVRLMAFLEQSNSRSMRAWIEATGAHRIDHEPIVNINTRADLVIYEQDRRSRT